MEAKDMYVYKLTRADGSSSYHRDTQAFLRRLDRLDLNDLYRLVQERFQDHPLEGHDFCGVHTLLMDGTLMEINMLVEKKYPLIKELLEKRLNLQLEAEEEMKRPKGIIENVLVGIDKFTIPVDFTILDILEDFKTPLILRRPFLSTAYAIINVFKAKITLSIGNDKNFFKSNKPTSNIIKRVYALSLIKIMELDNRSHDPKFEDYIELSDLNEPLELRHDQVVDLGPTIKEGEVIDTPVKEMVKTRHDDETPMELRIILVSEEDKWNEISHPYQKLKRFYKGVLDLGPKYIRDTKKEELVTRGYSSVHEMEE
ncbi:putative reverse transcriptase domain-containing protein [Tanacetum coccineum]